MKTFRNLKFIAHSIQGDGKQARIDFDNGYGVSVISGSMFYTDSEHPYELGVLYKGALTYNTHITDDVIGHLNAREVTKIMKQVQNLT